MSFKTKTHYEVSFPKSEITYIVGKSKKLNKTQVELLIDNVLNRALDDTVMEVKLWIEGKVAYRTGELQRDLKLQLDSSRVRNMVLKLKLGTMLSYAEFVNAMSMATVRHVNQKDYAYYGGHYGPINLNDPRAVANFFPKMIEYAKERLQINMAKAKTMYLGAAGKIGRMISSRMKWK